MARPETAPNLQERRYDWWGRAMTRRTRHAQMWLIVLFGVLLAPGAHGAEAISVDIMPRVCLEGSSVRVTVRIDPDPDIACC